MPNRRYAKMKLEDVFLLLSLTVLVIYLGGCGGSAPPTQPPPLAVVSTSPVNAAAGIDIPTSITAKFSRSMNPSTINSSNFLLMDGLTQISGTVNYVSLIATFTPSVALLPNKTYTAKITTGAKDLAGNSLASDFVWTFTTKDLPFKNYVATATGSWPEAVAIGDVNGDGKNDVVMTTFSSPISDPANDYKVFVFLQNASGGLDAPVKYATSSTSTCPASTVAIGDINGDGKNDIVIGNRECGIEVFTQNGSGNLNAGVTYNSLDGLRIRIADLNHDGLMDIAGIGLGTNTASIWLQNASGVLGAPVVYSVTHSGVDDLEVADINNDGLTDVVAMGLRTPSVGVLTQTAAGTFNPPSYYSAGVNILTNGLAVGDINGDGLNDVVVTDGGNSPGASIHVFPQNTLGTLDPAVNYISYDCPESVEIADITGDGRKDIMTLHGGWNAMGFYQQSANGSLQAETRFTIPYASHYNPHGLAVGDINGDGRSDVVIADYNNGLVVLYHY